MHGHMFICTYGKSSQNSLIVEDQIHFPSKITCGRSYMSVRDLNAHIQHRHLNLSSNSTTTIEDQFNTTNNNQPRANLITVMIAPPGQHQNKNNNDDNNKQYIHSHLNHHNSYLNDKNLMQMNHQLQPSLLPSPPLQQQLIMQPLLDIPPHQNKRQFDFNIKTPSSNNFNIPPNFY